jgi:hypothetical protein
MKPGASFTVDDSKFQAALLATLKETKRSVADAINSRMFFLMLRLFVLLPPKAPQQQRNKIASYLNQQVNEKQTRSRKTGKYLGRNRELKRVNLIAQARNAKAGGKGLYGPTMKKAVASLRRRAIGSVGYLRSGVVKAIRKINGGFTQFQTQVRDKGKKRYTKPNGALISLARQYGVEMSNVAVHRGTNATFRNATQGTGMSPKATVQIVVGLAAGQESNVSSIYNPAMQRALDDERKEMLDHIGGVLVGIVDEECGKRGFVVRKLL